MTEFQPIPLVQRVDYLLARARGRRVLHLGCTNAPYTDQSLRDGSLLHLKLRDVAAELHGTDLDSTGLATLASLGVTNLHQGDLVTLRDTLSSVPFDLVIAGEIIEHVPDAGAFVQSTHAVMGPQSTLIVSTVNAYCAFRMVQYAVRGRAGHAEPVHPDHVAYYSQSTLAHLLRQSGMKVTGRAFYDIGREHLPYVRRSLAVVNRVATTLAPQLADGIIVEARWPDAGGAAV